MAYSLPPRPPERRAPTYAIALLPFVLVVLTALVALLREHSTRPDHPTSGGDAAVDAVVSG